MSFLQEPTETQLALIKTDLGEDSDKFQHNLQLLQTWISCQPHLPQDYDNNLLNVFVRGCKHNLERTKRKLEMYFIARTKIPELFGDREISTELLDRYNRMMKIAVLPKLTPNGCRVTIYKITSNVDEWDTKDACRWAFVTGDLRVVNEVPLAGDIFVYDLGQLKAGHVIKYITPIIKKAFVAAYEAYPQRLKQLHFVNISPVADKILNFSRTLLKEKVKNRFVSHSSSDLSKYIPSNILPEEYGGNCGKFDVMVDEWTTYILKHKKWFQQQESVKAAEPFPERYCQFDEVNGIQGSFRRLGID